MHSTFDEAAKRRLRKSALATVATLSLCLGTFGIGCSFTVDTDLLDAGDDAIECGTDLKKCPIDLQDPDGPKECVDATSPQFGCATESCKSCEVSNSKARCLPNGECGISVCDEGFKDCNGVLSDGCEINVMTNVLNCGDCTRPTATGDHECNLPNAASEFCIKGLCEVAVCSKGFGNCDESRSNGCEVNLNTSLDHCGKCNTPCAGTCVDGECM